MSCNKKDDNSHELLPKTEDAPLPKSSDANIPLQGKTIAFMGGSQCQHAFESISPFFFSEFPLREALVQQEVKELRIVAKSGAGIARPEYTSRFSINVSKQALNLMLEEALDIYVVWIQTNDFTGSIAPLDYPTPLGELTDNPQIEDIVNDRQTFLGGLNFIVQILRAKNPQAKILLISPTRSIFDYRHGENDKGFTTSDIPFDGKTLYRYVKAMQAFADYQQLPFLDLFTTDNINIEGLSAEEIEALWLQTHMDAVHLAPSGYAALVDKIINFIKEKGAISEDEYE